MDSSHCAEVVERLTDGKRRRRERVDGAMGDGFCHGLEGEPSQTLMMMMMMIG